VFSADGAARHVFVAEPLLALGGLVSAPTNRGGVCDDPSPPTDKLLTNRIAIDNLLVNREST